MQREIGVPRSAYGNGPLLHRRKTAGTQEVEHRCDANPLYPSEPINLLKQLQYILKYRRLPASLGWVHTSFSYFDIGDGCPLSLEPGKAHSAFNPEEKVKEILKDSGSKELKAVVHDELWRNKYPKSFPVGNLA